MINESPRIYNGVGIYETGGGGESAWTCSHAQINGHWYPTIKKDGVEWLAQNLKEVYSGITLTDTWVSYSNANNNAYRFKMASTDYAQPDLENLLGYFYRAGCREIIRSNVASDGWRIPSIADFDKLTQNRNSSYACGLMSNISTLYSGHSGTAEHGFNGIGADHNGYSNFASFIVSDNSSIKGYGRVYSIRSDGNITLSSDGNSSVWYEVGACRLVRNY